MCGSATLTTVASRLAIALAATVATSATRPGADRRTSPLPVALAMGARYSGCRPKRGRPERARTLLKAAVEVLAGRPSSRVAVGVDRPDAVGRPAERVVAPDGDDGAAGRAP